MDKLFHLTDRAAYQRCATERLHGLKSRLIVGFTVAAMHALIVSFVEAALWYGAVAISQFYEVRKAHVLIDNESDEISPVLEFFFSAAIATLIYALIAPMIWLGWDNIGPAFASLALCGAILHVSLTTNQSKWMGAALMGPHAFALLALLGLDILRIEGERQIFDLFVFIVAFIFIRHAFHASHSLREAFALQIQANEQKDELIKQAEGLAEYRAETLRNVSHSIRTPLNGILGGLEILLLHGGNDEKVRRDILLCRGSAVALSRIVSEALDQDEAIGADLNSGTPVEKPSLGARQPTDIKDTSGPLRVLIVDDNVTNRMIAQRLLEKVNAEMVFAENGAEAVSRCHEQSFHLILMDIQMPVMDGLEATEKIRQMETGNGKAPILAVSANCQPDMIEKFFMAGIDDYVTKPYTKDKLLGAIENIGVLLNRDGSQPAADSDEVSNTDKNEAIHMLIDQDALTELEDVIGDEGVSEIIVASLAELKESIDGYKTAAADDNDEELRRLAHKIKGCAASICALALTDIASKAETDESARAEFADTLASSFSETQQYFEARYEGVG